MLRLQRQWFIHSFISVKSPQLRSPPTKWGKTHGHRPRSPTRTEGLHTMGRGLVPQEDRLRHCYQYPSTLQPPAHLPPWLGYTRALFDSVCRSKPQQVIPSTPVTASHVTQGRVRIHITLKYRRVDLWEARIRVTHVWLNHSVMTR